MAPTTYFCRLFILLLIISTGSLSIQGQRVYAPSGGTNSVLFGLGGSLTVGSILLDRGVKPLTEEDIKMLDFDRIWGIDRYSTRHLSFPADEFTDKLLVTSFASPFLLLLDQPGRDNFDDMALVVFQGALINSGLINLTKVVAKRARPYNYNPDAPLALKRKKSSRYSFFSGHVATSAYFSFTTAKLYSDLHPNSRARPLVWATAALIPATVAYGRMRAGRHFFTDVLVGFVAGTAIALTVPSLHKVGND
jgi:membrane-associated phospholipid phosphatase